MLRVIEKATPMATPQPPKDIYGLQRRESVRPISFGKVLRRIGSTATLLGVVNFYDQRFGIGFAAGQKEDLGNFLNAQETHVGQNSLRVCGRRGAPPGVSHECQAIPRG